MSVEDFFDNSDRDAERAGDGSPMLVPAAGGPRMAYTRASSLADEILDQRHIHRWQMRYLARGLGRHRDLADLAAVEEYSTSLDATVFGADKSASGRRLDDINARALDRMGINQRADYGTVVHAATEPGGFVPESAEANARAFWDWVHEYGIRIWATEVFTACDLTRSAGTFDHLMGVPGYGNIIVDKKTGKLDPHAFSIQLSTYARGDVYDVTTDERTSLEILTEGEEINREVGLILTISDGKCEPTEIDLDKGFHGALHAAATRDYKAIPRDALAAPAKLKKIHEVDDLVILVRKAPSLERLSALWQVNKSLWTDEHTQAAQQRRLELEA